VRSKDESKIESIYKATLKLVKDRGLAGITMSDISKAASIATGTLYIYFKNKDELIKALFTACRQHSAEQYFAGLDESDAFEEKLKRLFTNIIHYKMVHFEVSVFLEQAYHSPFGCATDLKKKQKMLVPLYALIDEGIAAQKIKEVEPELVVVFLFGIVNEMVKHTYYAGKKLTPEAVSQLYALFRSGI
jgi:AcrR family transcriptional regulator